MTHDGRLAAAASSHAAVYLPPQQDAFGTVALASELLVIVAGLAVIPFIVVEVAKGLLRRIAPDWADSALRATR